MISIVRAGCSACLKSPTKRFATGVRHCSKQASPHARETLTERASLLTCDVTDRKLASCLDAQDPLRDYREQFYIPKTGDEPVSYLCGNSLGLQHKGVEDSLHRHLKKWREQAVSGHFESPSPWFEIDQELREPMASLVGAKREEVVLMNTLTVNLHLLMLAFFKPVGRRRKILVERHPFPSDMWAVRSQLRLRGCDPDADLIEVGPSTSDDSGLSSFDNMQVLEVLEQHGDEIALVMIGGVHFLTGQLFDMKSITEKAHAKGCLVGFDLAHAAGNVPLQLHDWGVDFAMWCTYKYLNGGPGNIAGAFIHSQVDLSTLDRLEGWWGHKRENRFSLKRGFDASDGVASFQLSNPGVVNMASLQPSLELMAELGMERLRAKSLLLTGYLEVLLKQRLGPRIEILTPSEPASRGCQLSVRVLADLNSSDSAGQEYECGTNTGNKASILQQQLEQRAVVCDNRPPDILRLPPVPLYNGFEDVWRLVDHLDALLARS